MATKTRPTAVELEQELSDAIEAAIRAVLARHGLRVPSRSAVR